MASKEVAQKKCSASHISAAKVSIGIQTTKQCPTLFQISQLFSRLRHHDTFSGLPLPWDGIFSKVLFFDEKGAGKIVMKLMDHKWLNSTTRYTQPISPRQMGSRSQVIAKLETMEQNSSTRR